MRIKIHPSFIIYLAVVALLASPHSCAGTVFALAVHELFHLLIGRCMGEQFDALELTPFGGVITSDRENVPLSGLRGAITAAAGPFGNYCAILLLCAPSLRALLGEALIRQTMMANAAMMLLNLLPALPLDGGRIVFCLLGGLLGVSRAIRLLSDTGVAFGLALALTSCIGLAKWGFFNLSALMVGAYLTFYALQSRYSMLTAHLYTVVHERCAREERIRRMRFYRAPGQATLLSLVEPLERSDEAYFFVQTPMGVYGFDEKALCQALLVSPTSSVCEFAESSGQKLDTTTKNAKNS